MFEIDLLLTDIARARHLVEQQRGGAATDRSVAAAKRLEKLVAQIVEDPALRNKVRDEDIAVLRRKILSCAKSLEGSGRVPGRAWRFSLPGSTKRDFRRLAEDLAKRASTFLDGGSQRWP